MTRFEKQFFKAIYKNHGGFMPTFPLGRIVQLGDVVDIRHKRMDYLGSIKEDRINIQFKVDEDKTPSDLSWQENRSVSISFKAKGETPGTGSNLPAGKAGISLDFEKTGSFLFVPKGIRYNRIDNMATVRKQVLNRVSRDFFGMRKVFLIKEVAMVDSYSLIISTSSNGKLEVSADVENLSSSALADASISFTRHSEKSLAYSALGANGGSIFYKAEKIKLRKDVREALTKNNADLAMRNDDEILAISSGQLLEKSASEVFEFEEVTSEEIEELLGDDDFDPRTE